jgi:phage terminase large subunit GpA-like protein
METLLTNPEWMVRDILAETLEPPPPVDFLDWAERNVRFGSESPLPGPYNREQFPFFDRILEVLGPDHPARVIVLQKSAQLGGTVLAQIFTGGSLDLDPCLFMYIHPTTDNGTRWVNTKWRPMLRQTTALVSIFPSTKSRDAGNSMFYLERNDGRGALLVSGANSEASLSQVSPARQVQDDLSKWEMNNAGDPEDQADTRSKAFDWAKIFKISTPLVKAGCRISRAYKNSTQERFQVPCPQCGHMHALEWENFVSNIDPENPGAAHFTCPKNGCIIEQHDLRSMLAKGQWVATNPVAKNVGFFLWTAYSLLERWENIASRWLDSKGDAAKEQTFFNDWLGLPYEAAGEAPPWEEIKAQADESGHQRGIVPVGGLLLSLGLDCQSDRVEWHLRAHGRDVRAWTVDYGVVEYHISMEECRTGLDALLKRTWRDTFGNQRSPATVAIDGNAWTEDVYDWAKRHPASRVMMVRGVASEAAPFIARVKRERSRDGRLLRYARRFFNVGTAPMKAALYKNLSKRDPLSRGFNGFPKGMEDDFFQQLCSERRVPINRKDGYVEFRWKKDPSVRNEVLDTAIYADAGAIRQGWRTLTEEQWDALEAELEKPAVEKGQLDLEDLPVQARPVTAEPSPQSSPQSNTSAPKSEIPISKRLA